jgi:hypothetical protein
MSFTIQLKINTGIFLNNDTATLATANQSIHLDNTIKV